MKTLAKVGGFVGKVMEIDESRARFKLDYARFKDSLQRCFLGTKVY